MPREDLDEGRVENPTAIDDRGLPRIVRQWIDLKFEKLLETLREGSKASRRVHARGTSMP